MQRAMMSDSRYRMTYSDLLRFGEMDQDAAKARYEARRILDEIELDYHDFAHHYAYQRMMADSLAAFLAAPDPVAYLVGVKR